MRSPMMIGVVVLALGILTYIVVTKPGDDLPDGDTEILMEPNAPAVIEVSFDETSSGGFPPIAMGSTEGTAARTRLDSSPEIDLPNAQGSGLFVDFPEINESGMEVVLPEEGDIGLEIIEPEDDDPGMTYD